MSASSATCQAVNPRNDGFHKAYIMHLQAPHCPPDALQPHPEDRSAPLPYWGYQQQGNFARWGLKRRERNGNGHKQGLIQKSPVPPHTAPPASNIKLHHLGQADRRESHLRRPGLPSDWGPVGDPGFRGGVGSRPHWCVCAGKCGPGSKRQGGPALFLLVFSLDRGGTGAPASGIPRPTSFGSAGNRRRALKRKLASCLRSHHEKSTTRAGTWGTGGMLAYMRFVHSVPINYILLCSSPVKYSRFKILEYMAESSMLARLVS